MLDKADTRRFLNEAAGAMAMGEPGEVLEYCRRLLDLPENGLSEDVRRIEELAAELAKAEEARRAASKRLHDAAEKLLRNARKNWTAGEVVIALFGDDR